MLVQTDVRRIGPGADVILYRFTKTLDVEPLRKRCQEAPPITFRCYGKECTLPRQQLVFGKQHTFSGMTFTPEVEPDLLVEQCKQCAEGISGEGYDIIIVNFYRNGQDYISHHTDNEKDLAPGTDIYTFVFGPAVRSFQVKGPDRTLHSFELTHGDVAVMSGENFQRTCTHSVPRRMKVDNWRLSITLRQSLRSSR